MDKSYVIHNISKLRWNLKSNHLVRLITYPYINLQRLFTLKKYEHSIYSKKILSLKNKFKGEKCFIIGNGPSLTPVDLDKLKGEYCFAANKIFKIYDKTDWRPTFYSCVDKEVFLLIKDDILKLNCKYIFLEYTYRIPKKIKSKIYPVMHYTKFKLDKYKNIERPYVSEYPHKMLSCGYTVTFTAIQLAIFMGFKEIYLIGVDHNYSNKAGSNHFNKDEYELPIPNNLDQPTLAYEAAKQYADAHGIKIYNATRGGKLEVFERVDFDSLFPEDDKK